MSEFTTEIHRQALKDPQIPQTHRDHCYESMQVMMSESGAGGMSECLDAQHTAGGLYTLTFLPRLFGHTLKQ